MTERNEGRRRADDKSILGYPDDCDLLLLKVPPVLLVDEDEVEVIPRAELFVDVAEGGCEVEAAEEEPDGDRFAAHRCSVHNLKLCNRLALVVLIRRGTRRLSPDDRELHVLDLDSDQQEVYFADNNILEMVLGFIVLELDGVGNPLSRPPS